MFALTLFFFSLIGFPSILGGKTCSYGGYYSNEFEACIIEFYFASFDEALGLCSTLHGHLPSLHSKSEEIALAITKHTTSCTFERTTPFINRKIWLGWQNSTWTDGSLNDYNGTFMPDTEENPEYLVFNRNLLLWMEPRDNVSVILCLYPPMQVSTCPKSMESGYLLFHSSFFKTCSIANNQVNDFSTAKTECQVLDGHLPYIKSRSQNEYLFSLSILSNVTDPVWLGFDTQNNQWNDGSPSNFSLFAPGNREILDSGSCLVLEVTGEMAGFWSYRNCSESTAWVCVSEAH